jgi:trimeric autotransporter adhesin
MNHNFHSIWNNATGTFVAAPENAKACGGASRSSRRGARTPALRMTTLALGLALAHGAFAGAPVAVQLPNGGVVKAGSATIGTSGNTLTVDQSSSRAVIDWSSFNVGSQGTVNFVQPNASSVTLNRVSGNEGSVIDGALRANGQVFLLNPNGVLFGKNAVVDTGGLLASTLDISNADFMAGKSVFTSTGKLGSVTNQGRLTAAGGGYIALIGNRVSNDGVITARLGTVALASGDQVTLNFNGTSLVDVAVDRATFNALVENRQIIIADGGLVKLTASTADSLLNTVVNNTGVIQSETVANQAGRIFLLGEGGKVEVAGTLDASAPNGGDGGHIETSGTQVTIADGTHIATNAANGTTGTWLVDPTDFTVAASGGDITGATLTSELSSTNVQLQSGSGSTSGSGDININDVVSWSAHTLTLTAARNVNINAVMTATGAASLDLEPATANGADAAVAGGIVNVGMDNSGNFTGKVNFSGTGALTISGQLYTVINSLGSGASDTTAGTLQGMQGNLGGHYALGSDIDASATAAWNSGAGFAPVGRSSYFTGTFDGLGHTITGLTLNASGSNPSALFGSTEGTSSSGVFIRNVALTNLVQICPGTYDCAGLVGDAEGYSTIQNVSVSGGISSQELWDVGFIAGYLSSYNYSGPVFDTQIIHAFASGTISTNEANYVGGIVGEAYGNLTDVHTNVAMSFTPGYYYSGTYIGGVAGEMEYGNVANSTAVGSITMESAQAGGGYAYYQYIGGLVGYDGTPIINSHASVTIVSLCSFGSCYDGDSQIGGLVGYGEGSISNSYATGSITLNKEYNQDVGGLAGESGGPSIVNSYSTGAISAPASNNSDFGGLLGYAGGVTISTSYSNSSVSVGNSASFIGGFLGYTNSGGNFFSNLYATGAVTAGNSASAIGGFIGYSDTTNITNAYSTSPVTVGTNSDSIGGFVGNVNGSVVLTNVYAAGTMSTGAGSTNVGGLGGLATGGNNVITNSFWDTTATGQSSSAFGTGMTTAQMQTGANFDSATTANGNVNPGWDLTNDWIVYDGHTSPLLRAFMTPLTISTAPTKTYNGSATTGFVDYSTSVDSSHLLGTLTVSGAGRNVGTYSVTPSGQWSDQQGYVLTYVGGTTTVNPATLAVTAVGGSQIYNGATNAIVTLAGNQVVGDQVTLADTSATLADKNVGTGKAVSVTGISLSGADAGNYTLGNTTTTTTTNVTPATLTVSATGGTQVYNANKRANVTLSGSVVTGDVVRLSDVSAMMADKNIGNNKAVSVSGISIAGADAGNYVLQNTTASTTTNVTPATLTVSARGGTQVYNATTGANVTLRDSAFEGDVVTLSDASATLADKNVGNNKAVSVNGISIAGADAGNYILHNTTAATTTNVTPATLTVSATGGTQVYNASTGANVTLGGNAIEGDVVTLSDASATMANKNVGANKEVSVNGISISGADAGNYVLQNTTASTTTAVTPASLTVSATGGTQVYNATTGANVTLGGNAIEGDVVTLSDASATMADKNVGTNKAVSVSGISLSGADAGNYVLQNTTASTTTDVTPATLSVIASAQNQALANGMSVAVTLTANAIASDLVTVHDASATVPDASTGSGKVVTVNGITISGADAANYALVSASATTTVDILPSNGGGSATPTLSALPSVVGSATQTASTPELKASTIAPELAIPMSQTAMLNGANDAPSMLVYATPSSGGDASVTLGGLRSMMQFAPGQDVTVPVGNSKFISLLNGGVKLPAGVEQQFFVNSTGH